MALTTADRGQLDGIVQKMDSGGASTPDIQAVVNDFRQKYDPTGLAHLTDAHTAWSPGLLMKSFTDAANATHVPQVVGAGVGLLGGAIGGVLGGGLETAHQLYNATQGKGFDAGQIEQQAVNTAKSTANFGYTEGKTAVPGAMLSGFGPAVTAPLGATSVIQGQNDIQHGLAENDPARVLQGAANGAMGTLGVAQGLGQLPGVIANKGQGLFINPSAKATVSDSFAPGRGLIPNTEGGANFQGAVNNAVSPVSSAVQGSIKPMRGMLQNAAEKQFEAIANQTAKQKALDVKRGVQSVPTTLAQEQMRGTSLAGVSKEQAAANLTDAINNVEETHLQPALDSAPQKVSWEDFRNNWLDKAREVLGDRGPDYLKALDQINSTVDAFKQTHGDDVSVGNLNKIKSKYFWDKAYTPAGSPTANDTARLGGRVASDLIEKAVPDTSTQAINAHMGDLIRARDALVASTGKVVGGGRLSRLIGAGVASTLAASPAGKLFWSLGGDQFVKGYNSPEVRGGFAGGLLKASGAKVKPLNFQKGLLGEALQSKK